MTKEERLSWLQGFVNWLDRFLKPGQDDQELFESDENVWTNQHTPGDKP